MAISYRHDNQLISVAWPYYDFEGYCQRVICFSWSHHHGRVCEEEATCRLEGACAYLFSLKTLLYLIYYQAEKVRYMSDYKKSIE